MDSAEREKLVSDWLKCTNLIKRNLERCCIDHITESFMNKDQFIMCLNDSIKFGCEKTLDEACQALRVS